VHSNEQMRASSDSGGRRWLQCSQLGLSSSMCETTWGRFERAAQRAKYWFIHHSPFFM
jgi:hypothetical protein